MLLLQKVKSHYYRGNATHSIAFRRLCNLLIPIAILAIIAYTALFEADSRVVKELPSIIVITLMLLSVNISFLQDELNELKSKK